MLSVLINIIIGVEGVKVYQDEFVSVKTYNKIRIYKLNEFRMHYLVEQLNGEEFIKLLKDNEVKYIGNL